MTLAVSVSERSWRYRYMWDPWFQGSFALILENPRALSFEG